ncbi:hypothetical protein AMAG_08856 [Allomyces macrogynus ATCC 38327]|uniref:Uncharacterized protein n=1 Tax=Allomyces macrogynus (strain ATCC 38327) TaxID=578462 RepID=A0A0L0SMI9_ALLM3|nr:hypothetical protein AMAG_08856 [Allomyces macrogynus ATCC 38327]|eukprot:KNE63776.1 hypothetical protein AMAG_08856 [Allomyces macrogynus ATCC 38327]
MMVNERTGHLGRAVRRPRPPPPAPADNVPPENQCFCKLCNCGKHRCSRPDLPTATLPLAAVSEYHDRFPVHRGQYKVPVRLPEPPRIDADLPPRKQRPILRQVVKHKYAPSEHALDGTSGYAAAFKKWPTPPPPAAAKRRPSAAERDRQMAWSMPAIDASSRPSTTSTGAATSTPTSATTSRYESTSHADFATAATAAARARRTACVPPAPTPPDQPFTAVSEYAAVYLPARPIRDAPYRATYNPTEAPLESTSTMKADYAPHFHGPITRAQGPDKQAIPAVPTNGEWVSETHAAHDAKAHVPAPCRALEVRKKLGGKDAGMCRRGDGHIVMVHAARKPKRDGKLRPTVCPTYAVPRQKPM